MKTTKKSYPPQINKKKPLNLFFFLHKNQENIDSFATCQAFSSIVRFSYSFFPFNVPPFIIRYTTGTMYNKEIGQIELLSTV